LNIIVADQAPELAGLSQTSSCSGLSGRVDQILIWRQEFGSPSAESLIADTDSVAKKRSI
jgi:hypothetical protein